MGTESACKRAQAALTNANDRTQHPVEAELETTKCAAISLLHRKQSRSTHTPPRTHEERTEPYKLSSDLHICTVAGTGLRAYTGEGGVFYSGAKVRVNVSSKSSSLSFYLHLSTAQTIVLVRYRW